MRRIERRTLNTHIENFNYFSNGTRLPHGQCNVMTGNAYRTLGFNNMFGTLNRLVTPEIDQSVDHHELEEETNEEKMRSQAHTHK